jgi:cell division protein FtsW (lipid II flippase)
MAIGLNAFVNLGVVSGYLPTTGINAPLISYGGSNMVVTWMGIGLLCSIARTSPDPE